jgi:hypothetical protein
MLSSNKYLLKITVFMAVFFFCMKTSIAQIDSTFRSTYNPKRGAIVALSTSASYSIGMSALYTIWYKNYPQSSFHFFNDSEEWLQMDKMGHVGSTYYLSRWCSNIVNWTGQSQKKSALIGTAMGFGFLLTVETFDGFSSEWGFSNTDIIANTLGAVLFLGQELGWKEQRVSFRFSYHETKYPQYNPNILGSTWNEKILKDYNGQTYWLSANIHSFLKEESRFPKWLNVAIGYGADGMIGGNENETEYNGSAVPKFTRSRQFYIAPDIDLSKIKTNKKWIKTLTQTIGFLKFPTPALEFNQFGKVQFKPFYF